MGDAERRARALLRKYYADVPRREEVMDQAVLGLLGGHQTLLDAGSGDTLALLQHYGPHVGYAVGVDLVTPSEKPGARAAVTIADLATLPFKDGSFDVVVSRSVVEHLDRPEAVFGELARTLKPGGHLILTTPNWLFYSSLLAWALPYRIKDRLLHRVFTDEGYDHFPVFYRANTRRALRRVAAVAGLNVVRLQALRHFPYYFLFSPLLFRIGMLYDWTVTALHLDALQSTWLVIMERPR